MMSSRIADPAVETHLVGEPSARSPERFRMLLTAFVASAPWMAVKEAVEFFRAVNPAVAFPIHEKLLVNPAMVYGLLSRLGPPDARWIELDDGHTEEL